MVTTGTDGDDSFVVENFDKPQSFDGGAGNDVITIPGNVDDSPLLQSRVGSD